jgi:FkbM family methyltransferase
MFKKILRSTGIYPYLKYWRKKYFPSQTQIEEKNLLGEKILFYKQFIKSGDLCFDVGANIGNRTEAFLALGAAVIAVEPQPECFKMLQLRFGNKIKVVKGALGEKEAEGVMYVSESSEISSLSKDWIDSVSKSRFKTSSWNQRESVKITTMDNLLKAYGMPRFCKIDVEGYEEEVLKGLSQPIECISFEYTIPERLKSISSCLNRLSTIGTYNCNYTIGEQMNFEFQRWVSKSELIDRLTQISSNILFGDIYVRFINIKQEAK